MGNGVFRTLPPFSPHRQASNPDVPRVSEINITIARVPCAHNVCDIMVFDLRVARRTGQEKYILAVESHFEHSPGSK